MTSPLSGILLLPVDNTEQSYINERFPPGAKFSGLKSRSQPCIVTNRGSINKTLQQLPLQQQKYQHQKQHQHKLNQLIQPEPEQEQSTHGQTHIQHQNQQQLNQETRQEEQETQHHLHLSQKVKSDMTSTRDSKLNVSLPSLPFDNYPLTPRKNKNCSFVNNHKMYLKLKGYQLNNVYSLNRRRNSDNNGKVISSQDVANNAKRIAIANNIDLPPIHLSDKSLRDKKQQWQTIQEEVWKPQESRKLPSKNAVLPPHSKRLERELHVHGHVRTRDVNTLKLGKVLTQARMRELLNEEATTIPSGFYL